MFAVLITHANFHFRVLHSMTTIRKLYSNVVYNDVLIFGGGVDSGRRS